MDNFLSPYIDLKVGSTEVRNQFASLEVMLSSKQPADICEFALKLGLPDLGLVKDKEIELYIGYSGERSWKVFSGYVYEPRAPRFLCKDEALKLFKTEVIQTFLDVTPQDVINFGLKKAGITQMELDSKAYPKKDRFVAAGENVSDLVRRVNTTWKIYNDWYFKEKKFYWKPFTPVPGPVYSYRFEENILDLTFTTDREPYGQRKVGSTSSSGKLLTVVSPFINHGQEIEIIWPEIKATRFIVEAVKHFMNDVGALRTEIHFRELEV